MSGGVVMLRDRGAAMPDAQECFPPAQPVPHYRETQRAVAEFIALGGWCDALAWDAIFTEEQRLDIGKYVLRLRRQARKEEREARRR